MTKASAHRRHALRAFLHGEAAGGIVLIAAAALAMIAANWPATAHGYEALLHAKIGPTLAPALGPMTVHLWINDGLMALFFLLVGLEIKREFVGGRLASADRRRLPFIAAVAGMAVPALVFLLVAGDTPGLQPGWAIPAATDIAFAIGVLALLGSRVPSSLKLLLTTVAIVDDMGAVAIIAIAYTDSIRVLALAGAGLALLVLYVLNRRQVMALWPYLLAGAALWLFVLQSGVHATIAGVMTAMLVPLRRDEAGSPLHRLEHALHPWSAFAIVPLFGFANAGVSLTGVGLETFAQPLVLGIALGLFLGKQTGILAAIWGADRLGIARRPAGVSWGQLYGMALIAGIGFTMSLFIGGLAFADPAQMDAVKIGVLAGSIASALAGAAVLVVAGRRAHATR
ncbi:Na+/H+ antiporter NhaA [Sphingomonas aquatilis]|uniref:Na(+)/H(+) antiporter NhaA n=1 Tax=Sphingomonas aquatilis TaxID=93063 RepID=A0AAW3TTQ3_9SPHN|nr:Na+/H+ antiporter NhaA [Sphingomonas aquatilis]MBB3877063.1 NhaA family Na+:H+ antiporter [Sphingomonas aquatilis]MCI4656000.1 Na+/H+ antiporter NhaA [Sphingomonas aquatilis]GEM72415.1 Na(+)/H(+) antiporter NhaA [Sphingomonas aquatilis NBRC 16722]